MGEHTQLTFGKCRRGRFAGARSILRSAPRSASTIPAPFARNSLLDRIPELDHRSRRAHHNIFGGCINEYRSRSKLFYYIGSAFGVCAETKRRSLKVLIEVGCEMNDHIVVLYKLNVVALKYIVAGAARKIIGIEEPSHMRAQITAAARNKNFHL